MRVFLLVLLGTLGLCGASNAQHATGTENDAGPALAPKPVEAGEVRGRMLLEAGLADDGRLHVGIDGRVAGPVSLYGTVMTGGNSVYASGLAGVGTSIRVGRARWFVRPAARLGIEYRSDSVLPTAGASLTFGRRYGARTILHLRDPGDGTSVHFQMGGYISF